MCAVYKSLKGVKKKMSYGNVYIAADLKKGLSVERVAEKIKQRYSDISIARAEQIARTIKEKGDGIDIDWGRRRIRKGRPYIKWGTTVY